MNDRFFKWIAWFLIALAFALGIFLTRARADDQYLLQYVAGTAKKAGEDISTLREEVSGLKAAAEANTYWTKIVVGGIVALVLKDLYIYRKSK